MNAIFKGIEFSCFSIVVKEYKERNKRLWDLQIKLESLPLKTLTPLLESNKVYVSPEAKANEAASVIADSERCQMLSCLIHTQYHELLLAIDGYSVFCERVARFINIVMYNKLRFPGSSLQDLIFGKLPKCPICDTFALSQVIVCVFVSLPSFALLTAKSPTQEGAKIYCRGFVDNSNVSCPFHYCFVDLFNPTKLVDNSETNVEDVSCLARTEEFVIPVSSRMI